MTRSRRQRALRVLKGIAVGLALVFFTLSITLLWALRTGRAHPLVKRELTEQLKRACDLDLRLENLEIGLFPPEIEIGGIAILSPLSPEPLLAADQAQVGVAVLPLFYGRVQIVRAALLHPSASITLDHGVVRDLPRCLAPQPGPSPSKPMSSSEAIALGVDDFVLERGSFRIELVGQLTAVVEGLDLNLGKGRTGGSDLSLGLESVSVRTPTQAITITDVRALAHVAGPLTRPRAVSFKSVSLEALGARIGAEGSVDMVGPVIEARVSLDAPLSIVNQLVAAAPILAGSLHVAASFAGDLEHPRVAGTLKLDGAKVDVYAIADTTELDFRADKSGIEVTRLRARYGQGEVTGSVKIKADEHLSIGGEVQLGEWPLGRFIETMGLEGPWVDLRANGPVGVHGTLLPVRIGLEPDVDVRDFFVFDRPYDRPELNKKAPEGSVLFEVPKANVKADAIIEADGVEVERAMITSPNGKVMASGRFDFRETVGMSIAGTLEPFDFVDVGGAVATLPFAASGKLGVKVEGPYSNLGAHGYFDLEGVRIADIPFGSGRGTMSWSGTGLHFESIEGRLGESKYQGDVHVELAKGAELSIDGVVTEGRIEDALLPFAIDGREIGEPSGRFTAKMQLVGAARALTGPVSIELDEARVVGEGSIRGSVNARMEAGLIVLDQINLEKRGARILGNLRYDPASSALDLHLRAEGAPLASIDALSRSGASITGLLGADLVLEGRGRASTGTISLSLSQLNAYGVPLEGGQVFGRFKGEHVDFIGAMLPNDELTFEGRTKLESGLPYQAKLNLAEYDLPRLVAAMSGVGAERSITGSTVLSGTLDGSLVDWQDSAGTLALERGRVEIRSEQATSNDSALVIETSGPSDWKLRARALDTPKLTLLAPGSSIVLKGALGGGRTRLDVNGRLDLVVASRLFAPVEDSSGSLSVEASILGRDDGFELVGTGRVERAGLEWRNLPGKLTSASAEVTFSQSTILLEQIEARYESGRVGGNGQITLEGSGIGNLTLELHLDHVHPELVYPTFDLDGVLTGVITLEGALDRMALRGDVSVDRGVVRPKFEWSDLLAQAQNRLLPKVYDPASEFMEIDVSIHPQTPLRLVNGDIANLELVGDVRLVGTNQRMGLLGTMNSQPGGRVGFLSREYSIQGGTVDFRERDRFFPRYDVDLSAVACAHEISLNLVGTLDGNTITYSSKPEMSQSDIVACLFGGARIKDLEDAGDNAAASIAGQLLVEVTGVERQVKRLIPVDQIELTSEYSTRDRLYEPRLLVAKEILDGKVRLEYSSSLVRQDDQRATMRYRVSPDLTLKGGWTSSEEIPVGDVGVDVTYRWEF
ncbi:MAG: translocation/assembly module TamB domain-containing protein [Deltaproteobacteria bacterium]|nr:translocation/assembly module TamB domain-containing protein [Deltaproteobacteria bacterium]